MIVSWVGNDAHRGGKDAEFLTEKPVARGRLFILRMLTLFAAFIMASASLLAQTDGTLSSPIIPGDHPDPSIIRVGKTYWTTSTAGNWAPEFSLYRSEDLLHWVSAGAIFQHTPEWADRDFWAPELVSDGGRVLVYYVGRKRGGGLCVAVATASTPDGHYEDHGPIMCQEDGSIDPAFARDESGKPFLIWKEDGNSQGKLTPIFAQPLAEDLIHVAGEKTQLIVNEPESWEGGVVEAPYIMRHGGKFYMFYAGNACCGTGCKYAEGVARADHLLGPWEKDPANPIIRPNGAWKCPGHGTAVHTSQGKDVFLYHAYPTSGFAFLGRESVIDSIEWDAQGWPVVNQGRGPGTLRAGVKLAVGMSDSFPGTKLDGEWKWPIGHEPDVQVASGALTLTLPEGASQSFVARTLLSPTYKATVEIPAEGGVGLIGGAENDVTLSRHDGKLELWSVERGQRRSLWTMDAPAGALWVSVASMTPGEAGFSYKIASGAWIHAGETVNLKGLLPWDSGMRIGLVVDGKAGDQASFRQFLVTDQAAK
ncbi:beta-xylosidase [Granulicella aggregans]|uniref:Beta-xylosidase n=1 Tax=Granulicella aggregans TaxID=474949 RepID=A0A7W7ZDM6_9BACT|nr:glycoside hydrolase family 43 protein [Granulicella aggregans]MBB5057808.1 beta-xylosidase [Granulicella aggregans]